MWVIGQLRETAIPRVRRTTRISDQVLINAPRDLDIRTMVIGEPPKGTETGQYRFIDSMDQVNQIIPQGARVVYRRNALPPRKDV